MTKKSMLLACFLSIIPGLGLIYVDKTVFGVIVMIVAFLGLLISLTGIFAILGIPIFFFTDIIAFFATIFGVWNYRGGWKWL